MFLLQGIKEYDINPKKETISTIIKTKVIGVKAIYLFEFNF